MKAVFGFLLSIIKMAMAFALARLLSRVFARFAPFFIGASIPFWGSIKSTYETIADTIASLNIFTNDIAFLVVASLIASALLLKSYNIFYKK